MTNQSFISRVLVVAILLCTQNVAAFMNTPIAMLDRSHRFVTASLSHSSSSDEYTANEVQDMDALILSLSLEPTDTSRRQRLASVFAVELSKTASRRRFADLFDQVLAIVGDRVQLEAKKKAALERQTQDESDDEEVEESDDDSGDFMSMGKSPEERQLWALVDMMVQSKTLAKKAFGELGNKGTLQ